MSVAERVRTEPEWGHPVPNRPVSAIYEGVVSHRRFDPVEHAFSYRHYMTLLDLGELPEVLDPYRGFSARGPALAWLKREDHIGDPATSIADTVRAIVAERTGESADGPIRMLTSLRTFGHNFNPVSFFYCHRAGEESPFAVLAEVTNTPWGERHAYVVERADGDPGSPIRGRLEKGFHVSPLMGMEQTYDWETSVPGSELRVDIGSRAGERLTFSATLALRRRELSRATLNRMLARYPAISVQVMARIYWQALRLKLKGAPYFPHPER
ncbi:DUF1365 domain-containing protein [Thermoleophilia bacterium SCSIO 60948]|nr:DUF1365 domain-containing protein [Thermoleophilia bacterium SCSIO 60948]